jgi:hypothetical protein
MTRDEHRALRLLAGDVDKVEGAAPAHYAAGRHSMIIWSGSIFSRSAPSPITRFPTRIFSTAGCNGDLEC